jgi:hypothetical protein
MCHIIGRVTSRLRFPEAVPAEPRVTSEWPTTRELSDSLDLYSLLFLPPSKFTTTVRAVKRRASQNLLLQQTDLFALGLQNGSPCKNAKTWGNEEISP